MATLKYRDPADGQFKDVGGALNDLTDVDTVTVPPVAGNVLVWDGTQWEPGTSSGAYLPLTGGTLTGPLILDSTLHVEGYTTIDNSMTVHGSAYIEGSVEVGENGGGTYFQSYGQAIFNSTVTLSADPVTPLEATPKQYVDQVLTVSTDDPIATGVIPARDGLQWVVVTVA